MKRSKKVSRWVRPQAAITVVVAALLVFGGYLVLPDLLRPSQAASLPVIEPIFQPQTRRPALPIPAVDCAAVPCLALTFDDGPDAATTPRVLDILRQHRVKATFFLIGSRVAGNEHLVRQIHEDGHEIGNHTWSHRKISELSPQELEDDIATAQQAITEAGVPTPRLFRPPYGLFNPMIRSHVSMTVVAWNIDPEDWAAKKPEEIVQHVLSHARPGAIVDLHDTQAVTADALEAILADLEQKYHLVTVSELLDLPAGQPGIFYGR